MIFVLVFVIFCAVLIPSILHFKRNGFKKFTVFLILINFLVGAGLGIFFVDILLGSSAVNTEIEFNERNTNRPGRRDSRILMFISDSEGNSYWGLLGFPSQNLYEVNPVAVRIAYLPTTRFVLRVEREYRVIYSHSEAVWILLFAVGIGVLITSFKSKVKDSMNKKKKKRKR